MRSFIRYPGGKYKFKKFIEAELSKVNGYDEYREPFFGGGSIGLHMIKTLTRKTAWINDYDVGIACMWDAVARFPDQFNALIRGYTPSIEDFHSFKRYFLEAPKPKTDTEIIEAGFRKLVLHQISFSGLGVKSGGPLGGAVQNGETKYPIDCRWSAKSICSKVDAIHPHLHATRITNVDFIDLITDVGKKALLYLDPPYYDKGGDLYLHSFSEQDHVRLRDALIVTPHDWVLSYDNVPRIRELYDACATVIEIDANYTINTSTKKTELLILKRGHQSIITAAASLPDWATAT